VKSLTNFSQDLTGFQFACLLRHSSVKGRLLKGAAISGRNFKVHLDSYNQLPYLTGAQPHASRDEWKEIT
jgi:hypothetical protein